MKENKKTKESRISFLNKVLISIKDFEKYNIFIKEGVGQTIIYMLLLVLISVVILTGISAQNTIDTSNNFINKIKNQIYQISYKDATLSINENNKLEINESELINSKILIDTSDLSDEEINEYEKDLEKEKNIIIILKDKIYIQNESLEGKNIISYSEMEKDNKSEVDMLNNIINNWENYDSSAVNISLLLGLFAGLYYVYILDTLANVLILAIFCYITAKILKLDIKFMSSFNISAHAITLPVILNVIYASIRMFLDFEIPYFEIMYYGIAYIYIITALFMIKSDNIKMQINLQKIKDVQEQLKEELEIKSKREKDQKEKDDVKKRDKDKKEPKIKDEPEENNA